MKNKFLWIPLAWIACATLSSCWMDGECSDGDMICYEGYQNVCENNKWYVGSVCESTLACLDGERVCSYDGIPNVCEGGMWYEDGVCLPGERCNHGFCECTSGTFMCDANGIPWECVNRAWVERPACGLGEFCSNGRCICNENDAPFCAPNGDVVSCQRDQSGIPMLVAEKCMSDEVCRDGVCACINEGSGICDDKGKPWTCKNGSWTPLEDCAANEYCNNGKCQCAEENVKICDDKGKPWTCQNGQWIQRADCAADEICQNGQCLCQGTATSCSDKQSVRLQCENGSWKEIACDAKEVCKDGQCLCVEASRRCNGNGVPEVCSNGKWMAVEGCLSDSVCRDGYCVCRPNTKKCDDSDPSAVFVCSNSFEYQKGEICADDKVCIGGECKCEEGAKRCAASNLPEKCIDGQWVTQAACAEGLLCQSGECTCSDGVRSCADEQTPRVCTLGAWVNEDSCPTDTVCSGDGICACVSEKKCDANGIPQTCKDGVWSTQTEPCAEGLACQNGECIDVSCHNGLWDEEETAIDCGGSCEVACTPCAASDACQPDQMCDAATGFFCQKQCAKDSDCRNSEAEDGEYCRADHRCSPKIFETVWRVGATEEPMPIADEAESPDGGALTLVIPMHGSATPVCNVKVLWGDEPAGTALASGTTISQCSELKHTYAQPGIYTVKITGTLEGYGFANGDEPMAAEYLHNALIEIKSFGSVGLGTYAFARTAELTRFPTRDIPDASKLTTLQGMFAFSSSVSKLDPLWDTASVTQMDSAFEGNSVFDQDLSRLDYSKVASMTNFFEKTEKLTQKNYCALVSALGESPLASSLRQIDAYDCKNINE